MGNQHPGKLPVVAPQKILPPRPFSRKIVVSLGRQVLTAFESDGKVFLECDCVTGDSTHPTEPGTFYILRKERIYRSKTYNAQMDYAMFFTRDGKAIHKANSVWRITTVRLSNWPNRVWPR